ncbi:outer membrane efflux protein [Lucifera butyrica]|uniref:Outer membrane efflux protein n=1 Tax=Lucifera butyrica TaxID=1351585 RepID=A0A498RAY1_9FIRM|nr:TolC family protein [Lucifera butyrica]VBB07432.1 outer membrane efflux protein [Lucifera butyrica]
MMRKQMWKRHLAVAFSGGWLLLNATAAWADAPMLSLDDSVAMALKNNPSIQMAVDDKEKAAWGIKLAQAGKEPTFSLGSSATRGSANLETPAGNLFSTSLKLSVPLYTGGRVEGSVEEAKLNAQAADLGVETARAQVKLDATTAYFDVLQAHNMVQVNQEALDNLNGHLENVQAQYDAGTVAKVDVLRSEVEVANARQNLTKAQNDYNVAVASLNNTIGIPQSTQSILKDELTYTQFDLPLNECIQQALSNRPEVGQSEDTVAAAKAGVKVADSSGKPTIALSGLQGWSGPEFSSQDSNWSIGINASWNIFDGGLTHSQVKQAESTLDKVKEQDKQNRDAIELEVRQAYMNMKEAESRIETSKVAVDKAEEDVKIAQTKYAAGAGTNLDVIDAQLALTQAKTNYVQALYDYNANKAKLTKAIGER